MGSEKVPGTDSPLTCVLVHMGSSSAKSVALACALSLGLAAPAVAGDPPAAPTTPLAPLQPLLKVDGQLPATVGKAVRLDASGSTGDIRGFRWDLDGNGSYETDSGTTPYV